MALYFDITPEDLGRLNSQEAVALFHDLIFAEARRIGGIDLGKIAIPYSTKAINTPDGGIDGEVDDAHPIRDNLGIIKEGLTCYQVKTGTAEVRTVAKAREVITANNSICSRVESCVKQGGTLVIVLFGSDRPDSKNGQSIKALQEAIKEYLPDYPKYPKIEVWRQNQLVGFLQSYPSLCLKAKGLNSVDLDTIETWKSQREMKRHFESGDSQLLAIQAIRNSVLNGNTEPLRILGEAGVGKTRLVLEALDYAGCRECVIYVRKPSVIPPDFIRSLTSPDSCEQCVLVVDECDSGKHNDIWNRIAYAANRIKLITIYNAEELTSENRAIIKAEPLTLDETISIIASYDIPDYRARDLAHLCSGSPRVAHALGEQVSRTGDFNVLSMNDLWPRCIAESEDVNSEDTKKKLRVLKWLSLFRRFGYEGPFKEEGELLVSKIACETSIPKSEIREIIEQLRAKKFLQGDFTLYITPRMLHIWLWTTWWKEQGPGFKSDEFKQIGSLNGNNTLELSPQLMACFYDMLQYGRESDVVPSIVNDLLGDKGPFAEPAFLASSTGGRLLDTLADIAPHETLAYIEEQLAPFTANDLLEFRAGRRGFIGALQRIAHHSSLFDRAANALLKLATAENEPFANNATGVFCGLFENGIGVLAPSTASAEERFPTLQSIAESNDPAVRSIAIKAISCGLDVINTALKPVREADMLHGESAGWEPRTHGELWGAYRRIWSLASACLETYEENEREQLADAMVKRGVRLVSFIGNGTEVIGWLSNLAKSDYADKEKLIRGIARILRYSHRLSDEARDGLESLQNSLVGQGYQNEIRRFVGMNIFEDEFQANGEHTEFVKSKMKELAHQSLIEQEQLKAIMPWLISDKPARAFDFGLALGSCDANRTIWNEILSTMKHYTNRGGRESSGVDFRFCAGYLRAVFNVDENEWEHLITQVAFEPNLAGLLPAIACASGMNNTIFAIILNMYDNNTIDVRSLNPLRFGAVLTPLKPALVIRLLDSLIEQDEQNAARLAQGLAYVYIRDGGKLSTHLQRKLVTQKALYATVDNAQLMHQSFDDYCWREMSISLLKNEPEAAGDLAATSAEMLSSDMKTEDSYIVDVLLLASESDPTATWKAVAPYFISHDYWVTHAFTGWLHGSNKKPIDNIPPKTILSWIDEEPETRIRAMVGVISSDLRNGAGESLLAREILVKYGNQEQIRHSLLCSEHSYSWSGNQADAIETKIAKLQSYRGDEENPNVRVWIDEAIESFKSELIDARARDEREWW